MDLSKTINGFFASSQANRPCNLCNCIFSEDMTVLPSTHLNPSQPSTPSVAAVSSSKSTPNSQGNSNYEDVITPITHDDDNHFTSLQEEVPTWSSDPQFE
jgi:hypothetical protein